MNGSFSTVRLIGLVTMHNGSLSNGNGLNYQFIHGWEFDPSQNKLYFEALRHTSDEAGEEISEA